MMHPGTVHKPSIFAVKWSGSITERHCVMKAGRMGLFIFLPEEVCPKPDSELQQDVLYEEYCLACLPRLVRLQGCLGRRNSSALSGEGVILYVLSPDGEGVMARDPKDEPVVRHRFVLQRVLGLEIQSLENPE